MYYTYNMYPCAYWDNGFRYCQDSMYDDYNQCQYCANASMYSPYVFGQFDDMYNLFTDEMDYGFRFDDSEFLNEDRIINLKDYGPRPFAVNIDEATKQNSTFRTALWTGKYLQVTLMSIDVGDDIGVELHPDTDQFIRVEEGQGIVKMGNSKDRLDFQEEISDDFAVMVPAGKWHNIVNTGNEPLKVYSIYAPPHHPQGTVHTTKADAEAAENK